MNKSQKPETIFDASGKPISEPPDSTENLNLLPGVQALIETRLNGAVDRLREHNQTDLKNLAQDHAKKWRWVAGITTVVAIFFAIVAPLQIPKWIKEHVQLRMTEPMLKEAADEAIRTKMGQYVDEKVKPLKSEADALSRRIETLGDEISAKQSQIAKNQMSLREQLRVQQLAVASKAGSRAKYEQLKEIEVHKSELQIYAKAALKEIELYFDANRHQLTYQILVDPVSLQNAGYSADEVIYILRFSSELREGAVNTLHDLNRKTAVQELCDSLDSEQNLLVLARITRALEKLTGEKFRPLDINAVKTWWARNRNRTEYNSPYGGYLKARAYMRRRNLNEEDIRQIISFLDETIKSDSEALHARCLRGWFLVRLEKYGEAEREFKEVEEQSKDYRWLLFWRAALFMHQNKIDNAIDSLNQALEKSPALENFAKQLLVFKKLETNPNMKWPSEKAKAVNDD